jgi:hypothetical protein
MSVYKEFTNVLRRNVPEPRIWVPELRTRFHRKTEDVKLGRVGVRAGFGPKNGLERKTLVLASLRKTGV